MCSWRLDYKLVEGVLPIEYHGIREASGIAANCHTATLFGVLKYLNARSSLLTSASLLLSIQNYNIPFK